MDPLAQKPRQVLATDVDVKGKKRTVGDKVLRKNKHTDRVDGDFLVVDEKDQHKLVTDAVTLEVHKTVAVFIGHSAKILPHQFAITTSGDCRLPDNVVVSVWKEVNQKWYCRIQGTPMDQVRLKFDKVTPVLKGVLYLKICRTNLGNKSPAPAVYQETVVTQQQLEVHPHPQMAQGPTGQPLMTQPPTGEPLMTPIPMGQPPMPRPQMAHPHMTQPTGYPQMTQTAASATQPTPQSTRITRIRTRSQPMLLIFHDYISFSNQCMSRLRSSQLCLASSKRLAWTTRATRTSGRPFPRSTTPSLSLLASRECNSVCSARRL